MTDIICHLFPARLRHSTEIAEKCTMGTPLQRDYVCSRHMFVIIVNGDSIGIALVSVL